MMRAGARWPRRSETWLAACAVAAAVVATATVGAGRHVPGVSARSREWPVYGGSAASDRYSPLTAITTANVSQLVEAWRYDTGESGGFQVNPIVAMA